MTEDEAKKKWCPELAKRNAAELVAAIIEKSFYEPQPDNCIGSQCMMWRYINPSYVKGTEEDKKLSGYCGLGGKP